MAWTCAGPEHTPTISVTHICIGPPGSGKHRLPGVIHTRGLLFFLPPLLYRFMSPGGRDLLAFRHPI